MSSLVTVKVGTSGRWWWGSGGRPGMVPPNKSLNQTDMAGASLGSAHELRPPDVAGLRDLPRSHLLRTRGRRGPPGARPERRVDGLLRLPLRRARRRLP